LTTVNLFSIKLSQPLIIWTLLPWQKGLQIAMFACGFKTWEEAKKGKLAMIQ
jgi:hypothetical protein